MLHCSLSQILLSRHLSGDQSTHHAIWNVTNKTFQGYQILERTAEVNCKKKYHHRINLRVCLKSRMNLLVDFTFFIFFSNINACSGSGKGCVISLVALPARSFFRIPCPQDASVYCGCISDSKLRINEVSISVFSPWDFFCGVIHWFLKRPKSVNLQGHVQLSKSTLTPIQFCYF